MATHTFEKNPGFISLYDLPDQHVIGAVIVQMDDQGEYSSTFIPVNMDAVPSPETQELVGGYAATAFEMANLGVTS